MPKSKDASKDASEELGTEMYDRIRMTAGKLTPGGVDFVPKEILDKVSEKNGPFHILVGEVDGKKLELNYSSSKLHALLTDNWGKITGKLINLSGEGVSFDRQYHLKIIG